MSGQYLRRSDGQMDGETDRQTDNYRKTNMTPLDGGGGERRCYRTNIPLILSETIDIDF